MKGGEPPVVKTVAGVGKVKPNAYYIVRIKCYLLTEDTKLQLTHLSVEICLTPGLRDCLVVLTA